MQKKIIFCLAITSITTLNALNLSKVKKEVEILQRLEWKSSRGIFVCKDCLCGFEFEDYTKAQRSHNCLTEPLLKMSCDEEKRSQCSFCGKLFYFASREAHLHHFYCKRIKKNRGYVPKKKKSSRGKKRKLGID